MRNRLLSLGFLCLMAFFSTGCLNKLEKLTTDTKGEVELTRLTQTGGGALDLLSPDKSPFQQMAAAFRILRDSDAVPDDELAIYLGLSRPIDVLFIEENYPNVPYVSSKPDVQSDVDIGINPMTTKQYRSYLNAISLAIGALATGSKAMDPKNGDRVMRAATAILGARDFETQKMYDLHLDKTTHKEFSIYRKKGMLMLRGLAAKGIVKDVNDMELRREKLLGLSADLN